MCTTLAWTPIILRTGATYTFTRPHCAARSNDNIAQSGGRFRGDSQPIFGSGVDGLCYPFQKLYDNVRYMGNMDMLSGRDKITRRPVQRLYRYFHVLTADSRHSCAQNAAAITRHNRMMHVHQSNEWNVHTWGMRLR